MTGPARDSWIDGSDTGTRLVVWEGHCLLKGWWVDIKAGAGAEHIVTSLLALSWQPRDGEPVVTQLHPGPIIVHDGHFSQPLGSTDLLRAPAHFPVPSSRVVLREVSFIWHLYGGRDFGLHPTYRLETCR